MFIPWKSCSCCCIAVALVLAAPIARAEPVADWNARACAMLLEAKTPPGPSHRILAIAHAAVYEAVGSLVQRGAASASAPALAAAVAAANRATLLRLLPAQQGAIDGAYGAALGQIAAGSARDEGVAAGEAAAARILAARATDGVAAGESWRPVTAAGVYIPTTIPSSSNLAQRTPWLIASASAFRPGPPPQLDQAGWARDYNEVKSLGAKNSKERSAEQTVIAKFWEAAQPDIYYGLVRGVANRPGRSVLHNARLFAALSQGIDDALLATFEAKYHYNFWRPLTAIRNGDIDGNAATERDPSWLPLVDTPMHPEYPCAHCVVSGVVGTVLAAELGKGGVPPLSTASPSANGARRSWPTLDAFMQEVASARIYGGMHYRSTTEAGTAMGKQIGAHAAMRFQVRPD